MGIEQVFTDEHHQIIKAELPAGGAMPEHFATSDAFVIVVKGKAELVFKDGTGEIAGGGTFLIPAKKPHRLEIKENFQAYIVLAPGATIEGMGKKVVNLEQVPAAE